MRATALLFLSATCFGAGSEPIANTPTPEGRKEYLEIQSQLDAANRGSGSLARTGGQAQGCAAERNALILHTDRTPTDVVIRRTGAMLRSLKRTGLPHSLARRFDQRLGALATQAQAGSLAKSTGTAKFAEACALRRRLAFANPLMDFDSLFFVGYVMQDGRGHMCTQYYGWSAKMGGGLFILTGLKSDTQRLVNVLENSRITGGRLAGQSMDGWSFQSGDLDFDGRRIAFAATNSADMCYHIFTVNIDGTNLRQLTDGSTGSMDILLPNDSENDFDPCWLPNGRIAFMSERRGGFGRCHDNPMPTYTLYSMNDDGSDIICLSYHETNEWHPSVNNDGMIVYTRWDYLDRDDCIAHHLWYCYPDGRDPRAPHGNYPDPQTTMTGGNWSDGRRARPNGEWNIRAIPNSGKYVATSAGHHTQSFGHLVLIDPTVPDDNAMSQLRGITTNTTYWGDEDGGGPYGTAWPLSEEYFICGKDKQLILRDVFGNEELIYESNQVWRPIEPMPLRPRPRPPVVSTGTWQGERSGRDDHFRATISVVNVYNGDLPLPDGVKIKAMRIIQIIPKVTPRINQPKMGYPSESVPRYSLGTVSVEEDGSVYCEAPVGRQIYFQLLDENHMAVQSMRAGTYVHAGEQLSCIGCHEDKWKALPPPTQVPLAFQRPPSKLQPEPGAETGGVTAINYYRLVKPVFDNTCVPCHRQQPWAPTDMSYGAVEGLAFYFCGYGFPYLNGDIRTPTRGGSRTIPGMFGAHYSRMGKRLMDQTHQSAGITTEEFGRVCLWLDGNSNEFSSTADLDAQRRGEFVWPRMDMDHGNPTGVEQDRPVPGSATILRTLRIRPAPRAVVLRISGRVVTVDMNDVGRVEVLDVRGRTVRVIRAVPRHAAFDLGGLGRGTYVVLVRTACGTPVGSGRVVIR